MKIYVDSADTASWALPAGCPPIAGATTNPSLIFQAGLRVELPTYLNLVRAAGDAGLAELMLQLPRNDLAQTQAWGDALQQAAANARVRITVKLPCHADWLPCIQAVQAMGLPILLTALGSPVQLLWAQALKVQYVAPYVGRLAAEGRDVWALVRACVAVQNSSSATASASKQTGPMLLAASIKSPEVLAQLIGHGAGAVTLPPASLVAWSQDPLTQAAMAQFDSDVSASLQTR